MISTEEFDRRFDAGEDVSDYIDWSKARRPGWEARLADIRALAEGLRADAERNVGNTRAIYDALQWLLARVKS